MVMTSIPPMRMSKRPNPSTDVDKVYQRVEARRVSFMQLYNRMDTDLEHYDLVPFDGESGFSESFREGGYRTFTANEPRVFADKLVGYIADGKITARIMSYREDEEQQRANQAKRDFFHSAIRMANVRLENYMEPPVLEQIAWFGAIRGWVTARVLLRRTIDGNTMVDVTPRDPRDVIWETGPNGLLWVCHISNQSYQEIRMTHPDIKMPDVDPEQQEMIEVYDYYDSETNMVFAPGLEIKQRTKHGATRVPWVVVPATSNPKVSTTTIGSQLSMMGESCYRSTRDLYEKQNFVLSAMFTNVDRSRRGAYKVRSAMGEKSLKESPYQAGRQIQVADKEDIEPIEFPTLAEETGAFYGQVTGNIQRGSFPHTSYGELDQTISGYAIESLKSAQNSVVTPLVKSIERALRQIGEMLCTQYSSSAIWEPIAIPGKYDAMAPVLIARADPLEIKLSPAMPRDMAAMLQMAQAARDPGANGIPIMADPQIREQILEWDAEEDVQTLIDHQMARRMLPMAMIHNLHQAAIARGDMATAQIAQIQMQTEMLKMMNELGMSQMMGQQMGMGSGGEMFGGMAGLGGPSGGPPGQGGGQRGLPSPSTAPPETLGIPQSQPIQQAGSITPPGTPRPNRRNGVG